MDHGLLANQASALCDAAEGVHSLSERLHLVLDQVGSRRVCLTTSFGIEDQLLTAASVDVGGSIEIVTLDTGRLFPETLDVWRATEDRYGFAIHEFAPAPHAVEELVARDGRDGFYESVAKRLACCHVRKTVPLQRALEGVGIWVTGLRSEQSAARAGIPFAAVDEERGLLKVSPLHDWTRPEVLAELRARDVPVSALEFRGYRSVGCEPCTRAVRPHEQERAGRWWWESQASVKECGLHVTAA